jgi:hypothetical protein
MVSNATFANNAKVEMPDSNALLEKITEKNSPIEYVG